MEDTRKRARKPSAAAARRPAGKKSAGLADTTRKTTGRKASAETVVPSPAERDQMVRTAAYFRAQRRGFEPGREWEDWLAAEAEVVSRFGAAPARRVRKPASRGKSASS